MLIRIFCLFISRQFYVSGGRPWYDCVDIFSLLTNCYNVSTPLSASKWRIHDWIQELSPKWQYLRNSCMKKSDLFNQTLVIWLTKFSLTLSHHSPGASILRDRRLEISYLRFGAFYEDRNTTIPFRNKRSTSSKW
jgi:hypothetical protein